jgi:hypothetical protein
MSRLFLIVLVSAALSACALSPSNDGNPAVASNRRPQVAATPAPNPLDDFGCEWMGKGQRCGPDGRVIHY